MPLMICADTGMLIGLLLFLLLVGAVCAAPFIFAFIALLRWADARQKGPSEEPSPAAGSILGL